MEFMKNVILSACILSVILTIADHLKSGEKFSRQLNVIFALVFITGILSSVVKTGIDFNLPDYSSNNYTDYSGFESNANKVIELETELRINKAAEELLKKNNVSFEKISSDININDDGSISINKVEYKGDSFEIAERIIKNNLNAAEVSRIE